MTRIEVVRRTLLIRVIRVIRGQSSVQLLQHLPAVAHAEFQLGQLVVLLGPQEVLAGRWRERLARLTGSGEAKHFRDRPRRGARVGGPEIVAEERQGNGAA